MDSSKDADVPISPLVEEAVPSKECSVENVGSTFSAECAPSPTPVLKKEPLEEGEIECKCPESPHKARAFGEDVEHSSDTNPESCPAKTDVFSMIEIADKVENPDTVNQKLSDSDNDSGSDTSSISDGSISADDTFETGMRNRDMDLFEEVNALKNPPRVKGELCINDLPPVDEDLSISIPENAALEAIGNVSQIMEDNSIVVGSHPGKPALDSGTVLFISRDLPVGKVEEVFGPVPSPYYIVRFNSKEHLTSKKIELGKELFYAPHLNYLTNYVFMSIIRQMKGSDASWCNDTEPPVSCIEYSDDEEEREARRKLKNKGKDEKNEQTAGESPSNSNSPARVRRKRGRGRGYFNHGYDESHRQGSTGLTHDPIQEGWNAAMNRSPSGTFSHGFGHGASFGPPQSLLSCFQQPPQNRTSFCPMPQTFHTSAIHGFSQPPRFGGIPGGSRMSEPADLRRINYQFRQNEHNFVPPPPPPPPDY